MYFDNFFQSSPLCVVKTRKENFENNIIPGTFLQSKIGSNKVKTKGLAAKN